MKIMKQINIVPFVLIFFVLVFNSGYALAGNSKKAIRKVNVTANKSHIFRMKGLYIGQNINNAKKYLYKLNPASAQQIKKAGGDPLNFLDDTVANFIKDVWGESFGIEFDKVFFNGSLCIMGDTNDTLALIMIKEDDFVSLFNTPSTGKKFFYKFIRSYKLKGEISYGKLASLGSDSEDGWNLKTKDGYGIFYPSEVLLIYKAKNIGNETFN